MAPSNRRTVSTLALFTLVCMAASALDAKEYNRPQGIPNEQAAKLANIRAKSRLLDNQTQSFERNGELFTIQRGDVVNTDCGGVQIGVVDDPDVARNIRRQTTIVDGDVINAPGNNCRNSGRR
ncbi:MAG: hypothetical protein ACFB6S_06250 [Geminicoccaceae bacterium]